MHGKLSVWKSEVKVHKIKIKKKKEKNAQRNKHEKKKKNTGNKINCI